MVKNKSEFSYILKKEEMGGFQTGFFVQIEFFICRDKEI